jgi:hypothetical protein
MQLTVTLFPTMPTALLAITRMTISPALILTDENSLLNRHISALNVAPGYVIRTFEEKMVGPLFSAPPVRLAVHKNMEKLSTRLLNPDGHEDFLSAWNHVEDLAANELAAVFAAPPTPIFSATIALSGFPSAVGLLLQPDKHNSVRQVLATLGLRYDASYSRTGSVEDSTWASASRREG